MKPIDCQQTPLELILRDECDHPRYENVVDHLSSCTSCQSRLDELTADRSWWNQTRSALAESSELAAPTDLPQADTVVLTQLSDADDYLPSPTLTADIAAFIDPPRHPEMLGRIGKYEVEREIGRGGMGIVLKGFDSELNRPVAIKLLAPHLASGGTARQRFIREARAAAAVVHDNVIAIHGIETDSRLPAIVMPLIGGSSLQTHVEQHGAMDAVDVVRIGMQIASGLAAAHAQGLVHRDIKPANILLENDLTRVQITDFGLARAAHDSNLTHSGVIAGTPHFMSPEQALGESIDQRSDLFSLGSVLYFMATGELPFAGSTPMGVLQRVCNVDPKRPRELNPAVPEQLESIIEKLLEKNPNNRFDSANDLHSYLSDYIAHLQQPTNRKAPKRLMTASRRSRRSRRRKFAGGGILLAGCTALGIWAAGFPANQPTSPSQPKSSPAPSPTVISINQFDSDIESLSRDIAKLEATPSSIGYPVTEWSRDPLADIDSAVRQLETPRSAGAASDFDREVQSIDAAIRRLEQDVARPSQTSTSNQGQ